MSVLRRRFAGCPLTRFTPIVCRRASRAYFFHDLLFANFHLLDFSPPSTDTRFHCPPCKPFAWRALESPYAVWRPSLRCPRPDPRLWPRRLFLSLTLRHNGKIYLRASRQLSTGSSRSCRRRTGRRSLWTRKKLVCVVVLPFFGCSR